MKKIIIILCFIALSCDNKSEIESTDFEIGVLSGEVSYLDILTEEEVLNNENIEIEIKGKDNISIPTGLSTNSKGFKFEFGPLGYGKYSVKAKFKDMISKVMYQSTDSVEINASSQNPIINLTLEPYNQTIIIGKVKNSANMPVIDSEVFLYSDTLFLQRFKGSGGYVDKSITNKKGNAVFTSHTAGNYYLLSRLIIEEDTIYSSTNDLNPSIVLEKEINTIETTIE